MQDKIFTYDVAHIIILQFQTIKDYHLFVIIAVLLLMDCILLTAWSSTHSLYKESVSMTIKVSSIKDLRQFVVIAILLLIYCILLTAWSSTHPLYNESVSMTIKVS